MSKRGHTEEQILRALHQAEGGTRIGDLCREHGISEATYYVWKKKYAGLGLSELRELRQLREENSKLKRLVADLSLDLHIAPGDRPKKSCKASSPARLVALDASRLCGERAACSRLEKEGGLEFCNNKNFAIITVETRACILDSSNAPALELTLEATEVRFPGFLDSLAFVFSLTQP